MRKRDLLPLPCLDEPSLPSRGGLCRASKQRIPKRAWIERRGEEVIWAVNLLGGFDKSESLGTSGDCQRSAHAHIVETVGSIVLPDERPSPQEALRSLLRSDSRYGFEGTSSAGSVAPFGSAEVSLPDRVVKRS